MLLYKFRSISGEAFRFTQDLFINKRLFLPLAKLLNDPNEGVAVIDINNQYRMWANLIEEINRQNNIRICAFTENHKNSVVWSHYANEHKGICIEFDSDEIDTNNGLLKKVKYSNTVPTIKHNAEADERIVFLNKTIEWAYEEEWRYITKNNSSYLHFNEKAIKRVLVGARFNSDDLNLVQFWLSNYSPTRSIPIVKMVFVSTDYSLYEEDEINDKIPRVLEMINRIPPVISSKIPPPITNKNPPPEWEQVVSLQNNYKQGEAEDDEQTYVSRDQKNAKIGIWEKADIPGIRC